MSGLIRLGWAQVGARESRREVAWQLLHDLIGDPDVQISNPCPRCGAAHGPVHIEGAALTASISYAAGWAVAALAPAHTGAVGVDAEPESDPHRDHVGLDGILGPGRARVRDWVRVEAALKADRRGLRIEPGLVRVTPTDVGHGAEAASWHARIPGRAEQIAGWDLEGPPGVLVSAAVAGR